MYELVVTGIVCDAFNTHHLSEVGELNKRSIYGKQS